MKYNISEAARVTGKARSTIIRALKSGKLSTVRDEHGRKLIHSK